MNWSNGGDFTKSLLSLQMQLQTLLEGVGGTETAGLLDGLAKLTETERSVVIPRITQTINDIIQGEKRLMSEKDKELKKFEDSLYEGVLEALNGESDTKATTKGSGPKLAVVSGGKTARNLATFRKPVRIPTLIDLAKARESRKTRSGDLPRDLA